MRVSALLGLLVAIFAVIKEAPAVFSALYWTTALLEITCLVFAIVVCCKSKKPKGDEEEAHKKRRRKKKPVSDYGTDTDQPNSPKAAETIG